MSARPLYILLGISAFLIGSCWYWLGIGLPSPPRLEACYTFFSQSLTPALEYQATFVPAGTKSLLLKAGESAGITLLFASAGLSLALLAGFPLGVITSTRFWQGRRGSVFQKGLKYSLFALLRTLTTVQRSIHELLWAALFLAAFGLSELGAVFAIAIPYSGVFARVFADLIDEAPVEAADALGSAGASPLQVFSFVTLPVALPDMAAYVLYRYECAVRSSAILGFFGIPTLGYYIRASFENLHYREVWTYIYTLFFLVILLEIWSGRMRRSIVA